MYSEKGESSEVETRISLLLDSTDAGKNVLLPAEKKKSLSKQAADFLSAVAEGKGLSDDKKAAKRKTNNDSGHRKKSKNDIAIDKESIAANPGDYVGCRVAKYFESDGLYFGTVKKFSTRKADDDVDLWKIIYDDEDKEEYDIDDMVTYLSNYVELRDQDVDRT